MWQDGYFIFNVAFMKAGPMAAVTIQIASCDSGCNMGCDRFWEFCSHSVLIVLPSLCQRCSGAGRRWNNHSWTGRGNPWNARGWISTFPHSTTDCIPRRRVRNRARCLVPCGLECASGRAGAPTTSRAG